MRQSVELAVQPVHLFPFSNEFLFHIYSQRLESWWENKLLYKFGKLITHVYCFYFCYNKLAQTWWPKTIQIYYLIVMEVRSPKSVFVVWSQDFILIGLISKGSSVGVSVPLPFAASRVGLYSWVHGSFLHFQSQKSNIFRSLSASVKTSPSLTLILPLFYKDIAITSIGHILMTWDNFPHLKISNLITSTKTFCYIRYNIHRSRD